MVLRVVSGVLMPTAPNGSARISFETNEIIGVAPANLDDEEETGAAGVFNSRPCKVVSVRQFSGDPSTIDIHDSNLSATEVRIHWSAPGGNIEEISYQFIGEVVI